MIQKIQLRAFLDQISYKKKLRRSNMYFLREITIIVNAHFSTEMKKKEKKEDYH